MNGVAGFAGGAYALAAPLYIVEMADPKMRGALASLMQLMSCLGVAFVDILSIEDFAHWQIISGVCLIIPGGACFFWGYWDDQFNTCFNN